VIWANIVLGVLCVWLLCLWLAERRRKESCHRAHTSAVIRSQHYRHGLQHIHHEADKASENFLHAAEFVQWAHGYAEEVLEYRRLNREPF
jgi:hypothetical protein